MSAYRDKRDGRWRYRKLIYLPDGSKDRIEWPPPTATPSGPPRPPSVSTSIGGPRLTTTRSSAPRPPPSRMVIKEEPPTFQEWFEGRFWREWVVGRRNKPSEVEAKESVFRVHLKAAFGDKRLDEISVADIAQFRAQLVESKRSDKRINNILAVLSKALRYAADVGLLDRAPRVGMLKLERPELVAWSFEEYATLLETAEQDDPTWYLAVCLAGEAGLRIGEVRALDWKRDVDLVANTITVNQQRRAGTTGTPKGRTRRTLPMTATLRRALTSLSHIRTGYVVRNLDGTPMTDNQTKYHCYRLCRVAGLPEHGWHMLRHSFGTHAAQCGVNPWSLMMWMGHKRIDETMLYVNLARAHLRPLPPALLAAGEAEADPDRRVLAMLSKRANRVPTEQPKMRKPL